MAYVCVGVSFCKIVLEVFFYFHHIIVLINFIYMNLKFYDSISSSRL